MSLPSSPEPSSDAFESLFDAALATETLRPALALHDFAGQCDGELTFKEGDELVILLEDASAGWSLGAKTRERSEDLEPGLIPRRWYRVRSRPFKMAFAEVS